jgi:2,3-bisphosphoglycerate-dependent phosphoglycerate mutase
MDVPLTKQGEKEAREAGALLKAEGMSFDLAYSSVLSRAIKTLWLSLEEMGQMYIPQVRRRRRRRRHARPGALRWLTRPPPRPLAARIRS